MTFVPTNLRVKGSASRLRKFSVSSNVFGTCAREVSYRLRPHDGGNSFSFSGS